MVCRRLVPQTFLASVCLVLSHGAPADAGVWESIGPYGGPVNAVAVDPSIPTTVYAATSSGGMFASQGVFRSTDAGGSWTAAARQLGDVVALAIDPQTPSTLYAGGEVGDSSPPIPASTGQPPAR